jgi:uroporphyrin-III C-methyltransferase / precorrin-2 dehydrogenase / sirohydrochlorin ferrochelatase
VQYFPVFFDLDGQKVLVVGGGDVALRKVSLLARTGAAITVVAPEVAPEVLQLAAAGKLALSMREFLPADLDGSRLVIVATSRRAINRWIANICDARAIPVNVVDDRQASRFIMPAIIDRDPVLVAISTGGTSPVLARRLRERLEAFIPQSFGQLASWLRELRHAAIDRLRDSGERRHFFETLVDGAAARRFLAGDRRGAGRIAQQLLASASGAAPAAGEVTLVGAGPGDPELLTIKALRALQDADVILYDRLVSDAVLDLARRDATRICVGKMPRGNAPRVNTAGIDPAGAMAAGAMATGGSSVGDIAADGMSAPVKCAGAQNTPQSEINALLIEHARLGKRVVRLKGGDPFIFGRGGEELQALAAAGVRFSVVPGITAAVGCAAYAGIPLTHRDHAHSVTFVTGHADPDGAEPDWATLARVAHTAVFYMGLARLEHIVGRLLAHGASATTPAAVIAQGTTAAQRVVTATLGTLQQACAGANLQSPALLVIGDVVSLQGALAWFNSDAVADLSQTA